MSSAALPLPPESPAFQVLKDTFGYATFRPGQEEVIATILAGQSVLTVMPTGSGKSLCFQVPALVKQGLTLVVSPLVALMEDQVAALKLDGVAAETINSSRDRETNVAAWRRAASGELRLLYISPERLMTERMLAAFARLPLSLIAVDEAHCISRWGPSFRPEYEALQRLPEIFPEVPLAAFTATADEATQKDIAAKLFHGKGKTFVTGFDRPNISLAVDLQRDWKRQLVDYVKARPGESGIVYCLSRRKTEEAAELLAGEGFHALPYHAGLDSARRAAHQNTFMTEPGVVMAATIAFGMGIDKPDVRYVFHANLPANMEAYYQELGRAGRDGRPAEAFMLYGLNDIRQRRMFIEEDDGDADHKRREHKRLDALISYCETAQCRRQALLGYFGEDYLAENGGPCGNCDVCLNPPVTEDGTALAQQALVAVVQSGERFGAAHIVDLLRGGDTEKIRSQGHDRLPVYGAGKAEDKETWRSILRQLTAAEFLRLDITGHGGLSLTAAGQRLLQGDGDFRFRRDTARARGSKASARARKAMAAAELPSADEPLLAALKDLRLTFAKERGVPAYVIFGDRSLIEMARDKPQDRIAFARVFGVGEAKVRDFAEPFLQAISDFKENTVAGGG
ncbi:DNA helicase RecQ [Pelagibius marinus]|uniref:DNA helicase RecQ n=1 Tax=Pelagibius marinus TaxID=2762760 RepID=UPI001872B772|nr:DNA helicase RecQ [Pelagibius marinus]